MRVFVQLFLIRCAHARWWTGATAQLPDPGAAILTIKIGARHSFGVLRKTIAADLKVGSELRSFVNALAMLLMGVFSPCLLCAGLPRHARPTAHPGRS